MQTDARAKAESEATLRERISLAARAAKSAFWDWDLATNTVLWSPEMMDLFGVAGSERRGELDTWRIWRERLHPEDLPAAERDAIAALRAQSPLALEYRIVLPDGKILWMETRGDIVHDDQGQAVRMAGITSDVTDRKRAEQTAATYRTQLEQLLAERTTELGAARRRLEKSAYEVTENIPAGTYTMVQPPEGGLARFSFLSTRFLEICGVSRAAAEADPLNIFACVHPDDYDKWMGKNIHVFEHKLPFSEECRIVADGETRWIHAESVPRDLPDGSVVWEGVMTDITTRKEAELARIKSDRSMRLAASAARLGFWEIDISTRLDRWDEGMARIHGIRHEDFNGRWEKFVHPDDYDAVMRETRRMLESDSLFEMDYRIVRPSGEVRYIREHGNVIRDKDGRPISASGVMQDITERELAEDKIREAAQRMRLAASAAGIGFWSRDNATGIEEWDDEMLRICGVRREDFDGHWEPFVHHDDLAKVKRQRPDSAVVGQVSAYEYRIIGPGGEVRHLRALCTFVSDPQGAGLREIGVNFDITAEKEAAERERKLAARHRRELEQKLKTSLSAAAVAHEINQPLSAILLDSQMALQRIQGDSRELAQARAFLSSTISNAERTVETIGKMMSLLRSVQTNPKEVNLVNVLRSAELHAKDDLRAAGITLRVEATGRAVKVRGDEGQLLLAVSNLLRNAIEAMRPGDTVRPREIVISVAREHKAIVLSVADGGPGLPRETLAKIPLHTTKPQGNGLGLFIVKAVAENHGAKLEARQSALGGAELRLVFPAGK